MSMSRRILTAFAAVLAFCALIGSPALAGVRLALVIGNAKYQNVPALANPSNDAGDLAQALRGIGFEVIEQKDASREAMANAVRDFSERLRGVDVALFFYSGHGMQMNGENYLLPVDAKIENPADVRFNTINLTDIQQEMEGSGRANIIILDACRTNPFADKLAHSGRAVTARGLGRVDATGEGSLIVYATQPNNVAYDGTGRNSPFTASLLKHVVTPGLEVRQMLSRVRGDVLDVTERRQTPWDSSSLVGDVFLAGSPKTADSAAVAPAEAAPAAVAAVSPQPAPAATPTPNGTPATREADEPKTDCERVVYFAPPHASPEQIKRGKHIDWEAGLKICGAAVAADPGNASLQYHYAQTLFNTKNTPEAFQHFKIAADAGNMDAVVSLGFMYVMGKGVLKNDQNAFELFNKAALAGNSTAMGDLGLMYKEGRFVRQDPAKGLEWVEKAIEAGNSFALAQAAAFYFDGIGVERDYNAAAEYLQQAADLGDGYSLKFLAIMYERGLLGRADPEKAGELRQKAKDVDPGSMDPIVPMPKVTASAPVQHAAQRRYYVIRRYRFFGCGWVWC